MVLKSSFQNAVLRQGPAVVWVGTQTTNTIKTSQRTCGSPTKPGARRAGNSNKNGKQDFTGREIPVSFFG